jgi:UDP-N-acetylmuramoylalanine--D-glutamate ligase
MHTDELTGRRVVLLGMGADVRAALPAVLAAGPASVRVVDTALAVGSAVDGFEVVELGAAAADAEVFLRSPGFPRYLPVLVDARERGARMTTPLDLWLGTHGAGRTVVAITGTKGKSTTTDLVGHLAQAAGLRVGVAGNLGIPVFAQGWDHEAPIVVLEVSSYQAADLHHVPDIAVLTSLTEDHLDWHGGVERYHADKLRVLGDGVRSAAVVVVPAGSPEACRAAAPFDPVVVRSPEQTGELPMQRVQNAALAAEVVHRLGGPAPTDDLVLAAAARSMPGRLDRCDGPAGGPAAGVTFVDDALASNPSATAAGLVWARTLGLPTVVLLGGAARGVSAAPLADEAARWPAGQLHAVAVPDTGEELAAAAGIESAGSASSVEAAVELAIATLTRTAGDRDALRGVVLFSPAAPTPAGSGNWQNRSAAFRRAVLAL